MMVDVVPVETVHLGLIECETSPLLLLAAELIPPLVENSIGISVFVDNQLIGMGGLTETWPGVCMGWALPSVHANKHGLIYLREAKRFFEYMKKNMNARRVYTVSETNPQQDKWLRFLGFTEEGFHPKHGINEVDYKTWGWNR